MKWVLVVMHLNGMGSVMTGYSLAMPNKTACQAAMDDQFCRHVGWGQTCYSDEGEVVHGPGSGYERPETYCPKVGK